MDTDLAITLDRVSRGALAWDPSTRRLSFTPAGSSRLWRMEIEAAALRHRLQVLALLEEDPIDGSVLEATADRMVTDMIVAGASGRDPLHDLRPHDPRRHAHRTDGVRRDEPVAGARLSAVGA